MNMKLNSMKLLIFCILFVCLIPRLGQPCSTFCLDHLDQLVFGRNYDWMVDDGLVIVNKRHVQKTAAIMAPTTDEQPASWISKYGSVTFNQFGRELPCGGINEAGLVVEVMWLDETEYPATDSRPIIDNLQWIQYQLDNFSTVEEVIASDSNIRIKPAVAANIHYLVCDRMGNCASIEFIGGKLVYHTNETMPVKALTNSTYAESIEFLKKHKGFGGELPLPTSHNSLDRFVRAAHMVINYDPENTRSVVDYAFDTLISVAWADYTKWSIVYDIQNLRVYFRTFFNQQIRYIDLNALDFSCSTPVRILDMNTHLSGDVTNNFSDYTQQINRDLIGNVFREVEFLKDIPAEMLDGLSLYPESTVCTE